MTRGGRKSDQTAPERRCIVTGARGGKAGLIRFVLDPNQQVVPDLAGKLPGRGMWVTAGRAEIEQAAARGLFARAAKAPAKAPDGLADMVESGLAQRVIGLISLARKAGLAVAGFERVKEWLASGRAQVLLQASDGSARGKGKLWTPEGGRWFGCLTADEMGLSFGRASVIHGALAPGGLTDRVIVDASKLDGLRGQIGSYAAGEDSDTQ